MERLVDGARGCHDSLSNDLTPIDACEISVNDPHLGTINARLAHLSLPEEAGHWGTRRRQRQRLQGLTTKPNP